MATTTLTPVSKPTCFTSPSHYRLSSSLRIAFTDEDLDEYSELIGFCFYFFYTAVH